MTTPIFRDEQEEFADFILRVEDQRSGEVRRLLVYCREDSDIPLYRFMESLVRGGAASRAAPGGAAMTPRGGPNNEQRNHRACLG